MGEKTNISWCDHTWNPWVGCQKVSPACDGCFAENLIDHRFGRVAWGKPGLGTGTRDRTSEQTRNDPYRWHRKAMKAGTRPFVFCLSLGDIFDKHVPPAWRAEAFDTMRKTPALVYLLLTKRPQLILGLAHEAGGLPPNAAIGTTVEDQKRANLNVPALLEAKWELDPLFAFVSCEPLLSEVDLTNIRYRDGDADILMNALTAEAWVVNSDSAAAYTNATDGNVALDWIITGGETDQGEHRARMTHPAWTRLLRDQCTVTDTPFHHKQNGEWHPSADHEPGGCDAQQAAIHIDGRTNHRPTEVLGLVADRAPGWAGMCRVGKDVAGRMLDGLVHDARPIVPALKVAA